MEGSMGKEKTENKIRQMTVKNSLGQSIGGFTRNKRTDGEKSQS